MRLTREFELRLLFVLNELVPPILRDARWFGRLLLRLAFRGEAETFATFKDRALVMSDEEFASIYARAISFLPTETDLNKSCQDAILKTVVGPAVLEVGCGAGLLAGALSQQHDVTACDLVIRDNVIRRHPDVDFHEASAESLPFPNQSFDTVVTTHTIEHVRDIFAALSELRRVARQQIIIVVPAERPYRYTFNLHLHFFPYPHSLRALIGPNRTAQCEVLGGDLFYVEDLTSPGDPVMSRSAPHG